MKALITGASGQDGGYLAEGLSKTGYEVHCLIQYNSDDSYLKSIPDVKVYRAYMHFDPDLRDYIEDFKPDECYHLAARSIVFDAQWTDVMRVNAMLTSSLLEALWNKAPNCKVFFAGSSEMFGEALSSPQNEYSSFNPRSVYGISKLASHYMIKQYRKQGMFACTGIMYNHESSRRPEHFVTRKISKAVARIKLGKQDVLHIGNLEARRDWGYAPDYVEAMWRMLQLDEPEDFVIGTGELTSVRDLLQMAFEIVDLDYSRYIEVSEGCIRKSEENPLVADVSRAKRSLYWKPSKHITDIIEEMVLNDLQEESK